MPGKLVIGEVVGVHIDDDVLKDAGIERARGIATVLASDADNLYVVISARLLKPEIQIVLFITGL